VTRIVLIGALLVGIAGIVHGGLTDYHVDVETLAVLAALTGIYAERYAAATERRRAAISAVEKELDDNISVLQNDSRFKPQDQEKPEPRLYPRVAVAAAEACLAQGALSDDGDVDRAAALSHWREGADTFNRGVNLMELLFFGLYLITPDEVNVMLRVDEELQARRNKIIDETRAVQDALRSALGQEQSAGSDTYDALRRESEEPDGYIVTPKPSLGASEAQP